MELCDRTISAELRPGRELKPLANRRQGQLRAVEFNADLAALGFQSGPCAPEIANITRGNGCYQE
jgi:hypothetical protein